MKNNKLLTPVKKNWGFFAGYIIMTYILTQTIVNGSNRISLATDSLFGGNAVDLMNLVLPFVWLTLIGTTAAFFKSYFQTTFSVNVQTDIKNITTKKLAKLQYSYFDSNGTGTIMNKLISDVFLIEELFSEIIPQFAMNIITVITVGIYIIILDYRLFLVTVICYPLLMWLANVASKKLGKLSGKRRGLYDDLENTTLDAFNGMIVGRTYNLYEKMNVRIGTVVDSILKNEYTRTLVGSVSLVLGNIIRWIPKIVCYVFAMYEVFGGKMSLGALLAFSILLDRMVHPLGEIPSMINAVREQSVSFRRINDIVNQPDEVSGTNTYTPDASKPAITMEHINFSYDGERTIFSDLNLEIEMGKNTALVGSSGGGKSTVFRIMCGFYLPQSGSYKLFGHDYKDWDVRELRKNFALVSQNVYLFPDSIAVNVAYGRPGATIAEVKEACRYANIDEFIETLPDGYDTFVGERGVKLSGGQRQRISIARAFLKNAPILLLDEPTSAVDVGTERLIQQALDRISEGKTVVTIAHRLSTIENADKILVFDNGRIAESGSHEELLNMNGIYRGLYTKESQMEVSENGN